MQLIDSELVSDKSQILFVDDGSKDRTWELILANCENPHISAIKLAHNVGHQNALMAGISSAQQHSDCVVTIDADLQDDPSAIIEMVKEYLHGAEIVLGVRSSRKKDSFFKRFTAQSYYHFLASMGVESVYNHADFRLLGKKAIDALLAWKESNLYLRGIIPKLGFKTSKVFFERNVRAAGQSKYSFRKMMGLAVDGITSFSVKPLSFVIVMAFISLFGSIGLFIWLGIKSCLNITTAVLPSLFLCTSLILFSLGIHGSYIGKIYLETKHRPRFAIEETVIHENK